MLVIRVQVRPLFAIPHTQLAMQQVLLPSFILLALLLRPVTVLLPILVTLPLVLLLLLFFLFRQRQPVLIIVLAHL